MTIIRGAIALLSAGSLALSIHSAPPSSDTASDAIDALSSLTAIASDPSQAVLTDVVPGAVRPSADIAASTSGSDHTTTVPVDPADGITLSGSDEVTIGLPFAAKAADAASTPEGLFVFDNGNDSSTVPVLKDDGSVQITTVIASAEAPTRYAYPIDVPTGGRIEFDGQTVSILNAADELATGIAPAWATDANGAPVPTHYEVVGNTLTQVVEHSTDDAYPVVADPWAGNNLLVYANVTFEARGAIVNAKATTWGRTFNGLPTHASHVAELKQRLGPNHQHRVDYKNGTVREQFLCHVAGNYFEQGIYNMEDWYRSVHWAAQLNLVDQCNPK